MFKVKNSFFSKLIFGTVLASSLIFTSLDASAIGEFRPSRIYKFENKENLGSGITHESIHLKTTSGTWNINVIRMDVTNKYAEIKGLINPKGINYRGTVSSMVNESKAVAGVNGDYFNYNPLPSAMGTLINDGKVISSPIERAYALPTFYLTRDNKAGIEYFDRHIDVTRASDNMKIHINTLNKVTPKFDTLTLLDSNWGYQSIGTRFHKDLVEVVVKNDLVQEIRIGKSPVSIGEDTYIIAGRGSRAEILKKLKVGDKLNLNINTTPNLSNIKFAIGGGSTILRDGITVNTNIVDYSRHPRTGIGVNKDNTEIILVTVDGRQSSSDGMTQAEFSKLLRSLGAHQGLNLDGGGSTTMAVRKPQNNYSSVVNKPSGGSQRQVVNSIGVFSNSPKGVLDSIKILTEYDESFINTSNKITIKGLDSFFENVDLDTDFLDIKIEGPDHIFENGYLTALEDGIFNIKASYNDGQKVFKDSINLRVNGEIVDIYTEETELKVDPSKEYVLPQFYGQDNLGNKAKISNRDLTFTINENLGHVEAGKLITSSDPNSGYLLANFNKASESLAIISNINPFLNEEAPKTTSFKDPLNKKSELVSPDSFRLAILSKTDNIPSWENRFKLYSKLNDSQVSISLNGLTNEYNLYKNDIYRIDASNSYKENQRSSVFIANLDTRAGTISKSNSYQWMKLKNEIKNKPQKNIIITSQRNLSTINDPYEVKALHNMLVDIKKSGKNVFLVHGGNYYTSELRDGIRYLTIDSKNNKSTTDIENLSILEFVVNGDEISYSFEKVFK